MVVVVERRITVIDKGIVLLLLSVALPWDVCGPNVGSSAPDLYTSVPTLCMILCSFVVQLSAMQTSVILMHPPVQSLLFACTKLKTT
jgi:hypothetical protein